MSASRSAEVPDLPSAYELVICPDHDAVGEACRLAARGAEEGMLVWAREEPADDEEHPSRSRLPTADLSCALVLRPEQPRYTAMELPYVAAVSLGACIAAEVPPLTELRHGWPHRLLLGDARVGDVAAVPGPTVDDRYEWLVLGASVNVRRLPNSDVLGQTCLLAAGVDDAEPARVLAGFSRHFLSWVDRWSGEGFVPVRNAWLARIRGRGETESGFA